MRKVPLRRRDGSVCAFATVDDADYPALAYHRWYLAGLTGYVCRGSSVNGKHVTVLMHRQVLGLSPGDGRSTDHINRDKLDNRRANLRVTTHAQNHQNRVAKRGSTSRFRGVNWDVDRQAWRAQAQITGRQNQNYFGRFANEIDAALAVEAWRAQHMPFAQPDPALADHFHVAHHAAERERMAEAA